MFNLVGYNLTDYEMLSLQQDYRNFILSIIVAVITFISVALIYKDYKDRKDKERAEKSINIAESFAKDIVKPVSFIYALFEKFGLDKLINSVNFLKFIDFDLDELNELYTSEDIKNHKKIMEEYDPENKLRSVIYNTLNHLEYLCMNIVTEVADEKYIYNSLHQQFLKVISLLYIEISSTNIDNKNKYYTNIIQVYNMWTNKYIMSEKREKKLKKKLKPKIHKIN